MERYTGEGEPPCTCIVVTPKKKAKHNLNLSVQFHNGTVPSRTNKLKILRVTEQSLNFRLPRPALSQGK